MYTPHFKRDPEAAKRERENERRHREMYIATVLGVAVVAASAVIAMFAATVPYRIWYADYVMKRDNLWKSERPILSARLGRYKMLPDAEDVEFHPNVEVVITNGGSQPAMVRSHKIVIDLREPGAPRRPLFERALTFDGDCFDVQYDWPLIPPGGSFSVTCNREEPFTAEQVSALKASRLFASVIGVAIYESPLGFQYPLVLEENYYTHLPPDAKETFISQTHSITEFDPRDFPLKDPKGNSD